MLQLPTTQITFNLAKIPHTTEHKQFLTLLEMTTVNVNDSFLQTFLVHLHINLHTHLSFY